MKIIEFKLVDGYWIGYVDGEPRLKGKGLSKLLAKMAKWVKGQGE